MAEAVQAGEGHGQTYGSGPLVIPLEEFRRRHPQGTAHASTTSRVEARTHAAFQAIDVYGVAVKSVGELLLVIPRLPVGADQLSKDPRRALHNVDRPAHTIEQERNDSGIAVA